MALDSLGKGPLSPGLPNSRTPVPGNSTRAPIKHRHAGNNRPYAVCRKRHQPVTKKTVAKAARTKQ